MQEPVTVKQRTKIPKLPTKYGQSHEAGTLLVVHPSLMSNLGHRQRYSLERNNAKASSPLLSSVCPLP